MTIRTPSVKAQATMRSTRPRGSRKRMMTSTGMSCVLMAGSLNDALTTRVLFLITRCTFTEVTISGKVP